MVIAAAAPRARYASDPGRTRGRFHSEPISPTRNAFRRDCDRIIHSTAFRRLAYKTQVFVFHEGDHYRTRPTPTMEGGPAARSLAPRPAPGPPPFGHAGERVLAHCLAGYGGFDHNAQTLAVVTRLERRYAAFDGLNLTWDTLAGLGKDTAPPAAAA